MTIDDVEEIRVAAVMNGGVSLAIWIGGVSQELNTLCRSTPGDGSVYGSLLDLVRSTARVDVIAGTSAGGINGAFLALAQVYRADLSSLGLLWADRGGLLDLLRPATAADPPSLMRGDEYFLPELRAAFEKICPPGATLPRATPAEAPISLTITTSLMTGVTRQFVDDFGAPMTQAQHAGRLVLERAAQKPDDPFARSDIGAVLALASRSTASFPGAFEPSFVPVGPVGASGLRPDLTGIASFPVSRFVLDGGVLLNKPVRPALEAIARQPPGPQVRRVLAYVVPDPGELPAVVADAPDALPTFTQVMLDTLTRLPRAQAISAELDELRAHNEQVRTTRLLQPDALPLLAAQAPALAVALLPTYRVLRARRAALNVARRLLDIAAVPAVGAPPAFTPDELVAAFGADGPVLQRELPFVPESLDPEADGPWRWGIAPAERICWLLLDMLRRALSLAPVAATDLRADLRRRRERAGGLADTLRAMRIDDDRFWHDWALRLPAPPAVAEQRRTALAAWAGAALGAWPSLDPAAPGGGRDELLEGLERVTYALVDELVAAAVPLRTAAGKGAVAAPVEAAQLTALLDALALPGQANTVLPALLALEVASIGLGLPAPDLPQDVQIVQISGETPNGFGGPVGVAAKLAGVQLGHFGAFYKKSWRVNDWIWGRLDGATRMVQIVLGPARLRQLGLTSGYVLEQLRVIALGGPGGDTLAPAFEADRPKLVQELAFLDDPGAPLPPSLPFCAMAVARRLQGEAVVEELPRLVSAVREDVRHGGARDRGVGLADDYEQARPADGGLAPDVALRLFAHCDLALEQAAAEAGTDLFAKTVSRSAAVGISLADGKHSGLGPVRVITRSLRGLVLTLYALVYGATVGSRFGTAVVNGALAVGGALLAVALLDDHVPGVVAGLATVLVLAGLALAALRSRAWVFALVLGLPLTAVLALVLARDGGSALSGNASTVLAVAGLVVATMLLGTVRTPSAFPRWIAAGPLWLWFVGGLVLTLVVGAWLQQLDPGQILRFELAFTRDHAADQLQRWSDGKALADGRVYLWRDCAWALCYWIPLSAAAVWASRQLSSSGARAWALRGRTIAWLPVVAAAFDLVENAGLLLQVREATRTSVALYRTSGPDYLAPLTGVFAAWKLVLLLVVLGYVLATLGRMGWRAVRGA